MQTLPKKYLLLVGIAAVGIAGAAVWWHSYSHTREGAYSFYMQALKSAGINESVSLNGATYTISAGTLSPAATSSEEAIASLAYAEVLARRSPIFDLTGVNPSALASAVVQLTSTEGNLAQAQASSSDASYISSLYPTDFLAALAQLEAARQKFLRSGSDTDEQSYEALLQKTVLAGSKNAASYSAALTHYISGKNISIPNLGGMMTSQSLLDAAGQEEVRLKEASAAIAQQMSCLKGEVSLCDTAKLFVPTIPTVAPTAPAQDPALLAQISSLVNQVATSVPKKIVTVGLSSSACLSSLPGPYYFDYLLNKDPSMQEFFFYLGDVYFQKIDPQAEQASPFYAYLKDEDNLSYMTINPLMFYLCPEISSDYSRAHAINAIATFAQTHSDIAPAQRSALINAPSLLESSATSYLEAALKQEGPSQTPTLDALTALTLMYRDKTAALHTVVLEAAYINSHHASLSQGGIPFDVSAWELFLTHSASPSLYLSDNPTAGSSVVSLRVKNIDNLSLLQKQYTFYSQIHTSVPQSTILSDMKAMWQFEAY